LHFESQDISFEMRRLANAFLEFGPKIALKAGNGTELSAEGGSSTFTRLLQFAYTELMRFIVVDTADTRGSVAVFQSVELLSVEAHSADQDYSGWLLPAVHRALANSSLSLAELEGYAVCSGPGSFTGLRVGLTTVKAWAEIYGKPVAAVSRLRALAVNDSPAQEPFIAACIDARREQVFAALYARLGDGSEPLGEESVTSLPDFVAQVKEEAEGKPVRWVTPDPGMLESLPEWPSLAARGHILQMAPPPFAQRLGFLAYRKFRQGQTVDALALDANYVRRSDAELFWKGNKPALKAQW
jgi:tRNA threonylcarbamoyladenosine biosynthesis protein TsaB